MPHINYRRGETREFLRNKRNAYYRRWGRPVNWFKKLSSKKCRAVERMELKRIMIDYDDVIECDWVNDGPCNCPDAYVMIDTTPPFKTRKEIANWWYYD